MKPPSKIIPSLLVILALFVGSVFANPEHDKAIKDFKFNGLPFGTDTKTFKAKFPKAELSADQSDPKIGLLMYTMRDVSGIDLAAFYFQDDKLFRCTYIYSAKTTEKIGGWITVVEKVVDKFGKADEDCMGIDTVEKGHLANFFWKFPNVNRFIEADIREDMMKVIFTDTEGRDRMIERQKENAELGF